MGRPRTYDDDSVPFTPAWAEKITGVSRDADHPPWPASSPTTAEKTGGKSMVIVGAGLNHWYHMDMNYRGIINMLVMCGCVGQSGRWLEPLCGPGKTAPANRLATTGLRARLGASATAHELHLGVVCPYRPVAL